MTETTEDLAGATARSLMARQQLANTLVDMQARLAPARLMREGVDELRDAATELGRDALDHIRARPGQVVGIAAALVVFFARDRIADFISATGKRAVKPLRDRRVTSKNIASPRKDRP